MEISLMSAKKVMHALNQILRSLILVVMGRAELCWRQVDGDWPGDSRRRKFWISAVINLETKNLRVKFDGESFRLCNSPHKLFFDHLTLGSDFRTTEYFQRSSNLYTEDEKERVVLRQIMLHQQFRNFDSEQMPVVVLSRWNRRTVEDGAHRLSLLASRGINFARVGVAYWAVIPKSEERALRRHA